MVAFVLLFVVFLPITAFAEIAKTQSLKSNKVAKFEINKILQPTPEVIEYPTTLSKSRKKRNAVVVTPDFSATKTIQVSRYLG